MKISALSLRDLEYIVAVADKKHFGQAAQACHVSQPALSTQVKKIEGLLGVRLFERSNRSVVLTPRGAHIVQQARIVLDEAHKIVELTQTHHAPLTGTLRLGVIATLGPYLMPHLLAPLKKQFPTLTLLLKEGLTENLLHDLKTGQLDALLASATFTETGLKIIPLFKEPFLLALPKGHDLGGKKHLSSHDLRSEDMVLLEEGHCLADEALEICPKNRRGHALNFHATSLETLRHLVANGLGYTLMPYLAIHENKSLKTLLDYRALTDSKFVGRSIVLACRDRFPRMQDMEVLAQFIRGHLPEGLLPF